MESLEVEEPEVSTVQYQIMGDDVCLAPPWYYRVMVSSNLGLRS